MKRSLALLIFAAICVASAQAGDMKVKAAIARDQDSKPTNSFSTDVPKLYAFFYTSGSAKGEKLRGVWIAEDVGDAAPADTKIDEATVTGDQADFYGAFSITKPNKGWPPGKYRIEIYAGDELVTTVKFTIGADKAIKKESDDEDKDAASDD